MRIRSLAAAAAAVVLVNLIAVMPAQSARYTPTAPQVDRSVPGVVEPGHRMLPRRHGPATFKPSVTWPSTASGWQRSDRHKGVLLRVGEHKQIELDYSGFRYAYGADWSSRLQLVRLPECMPECSPERVSSHNDVSTGKLSATAGPGLYAAVAGASGPNGSFTATTLAPSGAWSAGGSSGDFNWSYPLKLPPSVGGDPPALALSYSSSSVDGRTAATNNQPSWIGEGFDFSPGYIERGYKSCADDGNDTGDRCWGTDNATVSLNGKVTELILDDTSRVWRLRDDIGSRVERLTGANNGDNDGEHWRITTTEGTRYYFETAWTVPVFGNSAGEPCHAATFDASWCQQAYRWNLSKVVDVHGNTTVYSYETETNHYARNRDATKATPYVRGGYLTRIEYGAARVVLETAERCAEAVCDRARPHTYPDTPLDQTCDGGTCVDKAAPTFWTAKRLAKIKTQVLRDGAYADVDTWTLRHTFPSPGDGTRAGMWLAGITRAGLPEVTFDPVQLPNRVVGNDTQAPMNWFRIRNIFTESGGTITVDYLPGECSRSGTIVMPAQPEGNAMRCFPVVLPVAGSATETTLDWFHKYVVGQVSLTDRVGGNPAVTTRYEYDGGGAWHFDDLDGLTDPKYKTWSQWRGYAKVRAIGGSPADVRTKTETLFYRGMGGALTDSDGGTVADHDEFAGSSREQIVYNGVGASVVSRTLTESWRSAPTATRVSSWGTGRSHFTGTGKSVSLTAVSGGPWRRAESVNEFNDLGMVVQTASSDSVGARCTGTTYSQNSDLLVVVPIHVVTTSAACGATGHVIADVKTSYDGRPWGDMPGKGDPTSVAEHGVVTTRRMFDSHGRIVESYDAKGGKTTTAYTPATGGPVIATEVINPLGHVTTTRLDPGAGLPVRVTDPNGRQVDMEYDTLGRLVRAWSSDRPRSGGYPAVAEYAYVVRTDGPAVVTTKTLKPDGTYLTAFVLHDGLLRPRQTQAPAPGGGRRVTDTFHNSLGQAYKTNTIYYNAEPPGDALFAVADGVVPIQQVAMFDGAGRPIAEVQRSLGTEKWRTVTTYDGDSTTVVPPAGGVRTTTVTDGRGRVSALHQHPHNGAGPEVTSYSYDDADRLSSVTDPAGSVWQQGYDLRGRKIRDEDPDKGVTTMSYNDADELFSATDANNVTLKYTYDALGRKTALHRGTAKLAAWTYDSVTGGVGFPAGAYRYTSGGTYSKRVLEYDGAYRPLATRFSLPTAEGALAGIYDYQYSYYVDGSLASTTYPAAGDLPAETVAHSYDALGAPSTTYSALNYYVSRSDYTKYGELSQLRLSKGADNQPGGVAWRTFAYEESSRRPQRAVMERSAGPNVLADIGYDYDPAGNVVRIADTPAGGQHDIQCFRYDFLRRLTDAWTTPSTCDSPTSAGPAPYQMSWSYDRSGNRLSQTGAMAATYAYDAHRLRQAGSIAYSYDATGNVVTRGPQSLTWDAEGNLTSVSEGASTTSFVYAADGDRLLRKDPNATTLYLEGQEVRLDRSTGTLSGARYYSHGSDAVAMRTASALTWLADDHEGTASIGVEAESLNVVGRRWTPFGAPRGSLTAFPGEKGFVGGTIDASTGLTHLGAREYDPVLGRFISVDPAMDHEDPQQMNGYTYANNNPVTFSDSDGRWPKWAKKISKHFGTVATVLSVAALIITPVCPVAGLLIGVVAAGLQAVETYRSCGTDYSSTDCVLDAISMVPAGRALGVFKKEIKHAVHAEKHVNKAAKEAKQYLAKDHAGGRQHVKKLNKLERKFKEANGEMTEFASPTIWTAAEMSTSTAHMVWPKKSDKKDESSPQRPKARAKRPGIEPGVYGPPLPEPPGDVRKRVGHGLYIM